LMLRLIFWSQFYVCL